MCCGPWTITARSRNSSGGSPSKSRPPCPAIRPAPGSQGQPERRRSPRPASLRSTPDRPGQSPQTRPGRRQGQGKLEPDRRVDQRRQPEADRADPGPSPRVADRRRQRQPAQREPDQAVEQGRLEQVVRADVPRLGHQDQDHAPPARPASPIRARPTGPGGRPRASSPPGSGRTARPAPPPARAAGSPSRAGPGSPGAG